MRNQLNIGIILLTISALMALAGIVYYFVVGKKSKATFFYLWCHVLAFIWSVGQMLEINAQHVEMKILAAKIQFFPICFIGWSWLMFVLTFTENTYVKKKKNAILLLILPTFFFIIAETNEWHHLFFSFFQLWHVEYGILFWFHTTFTYIYIFTGSMLLIFHSVKQYGKTSKETILLILAISVPVIINIFFILRIIYFYFDITPASFTLSFTLYTIVSVRSRFLNIIPIALREIVNNLREAIVVIDYNQKIGDFNSTFKTTFSKVMEINKGDDINFFFEKLALFVDNKAELTRLKDSLQEIQARTRPLVQGELWINILKQKNYSVSIQPVINSAGRIIGKVLIFNDVSELKKLNHELENKNVELSTAYQQLKEYADSVEELTVLKERNRFAIDLHDTIGHTFTILLRIHEACLIASINDPDKTQELLNEANKIIRAGLKEIRRSISGLRPQKTAADNFIELIQALIADFKHAGMNIELLVHGNSTYDLNEYSDTLYRVCQESLTNSLRHGKASEVNIALCLTAERIKLFIVDNGCGCKQIKTGVGLKGMQERIRKFGGSLVFGSDGQSGFNIHMEIPVYTATLKSLKTGV
jgi:signal transduction histidine kinase